MSNINMDNIMKKVKKKVSNSSFLAEKLKGREFDITCHECNKDITIVVTENLTGICPLCGHENVLSFGFA